MSEKPLDWETIQKYMNLQKTMHKCLRCGECCRGFEVSGVPEYCDGHKPSGKNCMHLIPSKKNEETGKWTPSECKIHNTTQYPKECKDFAMGFGDCSLGQAIIKNRQENRSK